jgi:hypothetical protein
MKSPKNDLFTCLKTRLNPHNFWLVETEKDKVNVYFQGDKNARNMVLIVTLEHYQVGKIIDPAAPYGDPLIVRRLSNEGLGEWSQKAIDHMIRLTGSKGNQYKNALQTILVNVAPEAPKGKQ